MALGLAQHRGGIVAQVGLLSTHFGVRLQHRIQITLQLIAIDAQFVEHKRDHVLVGLQHRLEQVRRFNALLLEPAGNLSGLLQRFLGLYGIVVKVHVVVGLGLRCLSFYNQVSDHLTF